MREKSFKEIEQEYERRKLEVQNMGGKNGRWQKCPRCSGTLVATCDTCKGLGHVTTQVAGLRGSSAKIPCSACEGRGQTRCRHSPCQGGWVWVKNTEG